MCIRDSMSIDSNATTNIATDGAIDFRNIIPLVVISRRVYTLSLIHIYGYTGYCKAAANMG